MISWSEFLMEAGDIILPKIYRDYARIDEGSYEYNQVCIDRGDIVIDAGANAGCFSAVAAWGGAKVYAFEPITDIYNYLVR